MYLKQKANNSFFTGEDSRVLDLTTRGNSGSTRVATRDATRDTSSDEQTRGSVVSESREVHPVASDSDNRPSPSRVGVT